MFNDADHAYAYLRVIGAQDVLHSNGRSLYEHLIGTFQILRRWANPLDVCLAGLFHSVYGTSRFPAPFGSISRPALVEIIGPNAEHLCHLFHRVNRASMMLCAARGTFEAVCSGQETVALKPGELRALVEIVLANVLEQSDSSCDIFKGELFIPPAGRYAKLLSVSALRELAARI